MMRHSSVSLRLTVWYACISCCGIAVSGIIVWFVLSTSVLAWKDRTISMRANRVSALVSAQPASSGPALSQNLNSLVGILPEGELIQILDQNGSRLFPTDGPSPIELPVTRCGSREIRNVRIHREHFRLLCMPLQYAARPAYLVVPSSLIENEILSRHLTLTLFAMSPVLLLISSLGAYVLSRRAMHPVGALILEARSLTGNDLSRRLPVPTAEDEMRRLALEWNSMLARIEEAMKRVQQFTADASHELRSPIAFIRGTAQECLHNTMDHETREALHAIVDETKLTGELLGSLLCLARADAGREPRSSEIISLTESLREVRQRFEPLARSRRQSLTFAGVQTEDIQIAMGRDHLQRILNILLDNAIKYTQPGGDITVTAHLSESLQIVVRDTGCGIAEEHLPHVCDRFYRVDTARTGADGAGIGLSIAQSLLGIYGAQLVVESVLGAGTEVTIILPAFLLAGEAVLVAEIR